MTTSSRSRPRTVLYLAESDATARNGAAALEGVRSSVDWTVEPLTTDALETLADRIPDADCIVFAETPTTAAGATLLEAIDVCGSTPLVLFTDASYAPTAARATDGIDGYVRRDTDGAIAHLADEVAWVCETGDEDHGSARDSDVTTASEGGTPTTRPPADRLLPSVHRMAACSDRNELFEELVEAVSDALEVESCWLSTVHFGEFTPRAAAGAITTDDLEPTPREGGLDEALRSGEPVRIDEPATDDLLAVPTEGIESVYCVPVGDVGLLGVTLAESTALDDRDRDLLAAWCRVGAAVLERLETEANLRNDRDRLRRERDRLQARLDRLVDDHDDLEAERDRIRTLLASVPEPALWYEIDDDGPVVRGVTDAFVEVFGADPERVVGAHLDETSVPPGLEGRQESVLETLGAADRRQFAARSDTVDGVREFRVTVVPPETIHDGDAETERGPTGLIVYSDVTEANRHERELAGVERRLEILADVLEEDLRPALNLARGYLELAEETGDAEHFAEVEEAQDRLHDRLGELVAVVRQDGAVVETEPVSLHDVARRAWADVETGNAQLRADGNLILEADEAKIRELFERLFRAAVSREGGESADAAGDGLVVTVGATDDGFHVTGIDVDGTGFGLEAVERIADAHDWTVGVDGDEGIVFRGVESDDVNGI